MPREKNRPVFMAALGCAVLGLAACDDAHWVGQAIKGGQGIGAPSGASGGTSGAGGAAPGATGGTGGQPGCQSNVLGEEGVCLDVVTLKRNAYDACQKIGLTFSDYAPSDACGTESYRYVKYTCCGPASPPPPPPTCVTKSQGSSSSCKSAAIWKQYSSDDCAATGATLTDYSPYEDCGDGGTRYVKYTCCGPTSPPPPPPPTCVTKSHGGSSSCQPDATWKQYASDDCAAAGAILTGYSPFHDCSDGSSRDVQYTCCPPEAAPPPSACETKTQGSSSSCKPAVTWKQYASEDCAATGATLTDYSPYDDCGDGNTRYVKYACCGPTPPPAK